MKESKRGRKPLAADAGTQEAAAPGSRQAPQLHVTEQGQSLATDGAVAGIEVLPEDAGVRLDQFLVSRLPEVSRVRVQQLIEQRKILLNGSPAKPSLKLKGGEHIEVVGEVRPAPLRAVAEDIPLDVVYEDRDLAVINKPAGMMVHAGAGSGDDPRNRGTLVNALLYRFARLSEASGELRPGIVHRLDKDTSGLLIVAKNDVVHRKLSEQFSSRQISKRYLGLVHGWPKAETGTISAAIGRDRLHRTRMTTRGTHGREALSHYTVVERITLALRPLCPAVREDRNRAHAPDTGSPFLDRPPHRRRHALRRAAGAFAPWLVARVGGRTHLAAHGGEESPLQACLGGGSCWLCPRNFLHSAEIEFTHPRTGKRLQFQASLPADLERFLLRLRRSD